jgi:TolB-like protein/DNA-binding winged helix-turn-helix (wHTH) protein/tetratricopeptide (TPR) repeat protein
MNAPPGHAPQRAHDAAAIYRAGDLTIDTGRQRVLRDEREIPLPKLSFDLLLTLVRAAPNVVTLDALTQEVWPNVVVSPETLSQRVKLLRVALGDDSRNPRYIASLRGRGYRFIQPVVNLSSREDAEHIAAAAPQAAPARRGRYLPWLGGAALVVAAIGAVLLMSDNRERERPDTPARLIAAAPSTRTVAVLPFQHLGDEADNEYIAFGLAEGLLHRLASIRDLTLIARTSSFAAAQPGADAQTIGQKLNARYLIEGSVQRAGRRLRVTAQLIDSASGAHVWSLRFDRTLEDIFAVEDEITQHVAQALQVTLTEDRHPYARFGTDAYLALLQGRALMATRRTVDAERAIERFKHVTEIAPDFAMAYVDLANAHVNLGNLRAQYLFSDPTKDAIRQAHPLVEKALQLDEALGEAYVLRGFIKAFEGEVAGAEADYRNGLELAPNYGLGYEQFTEFLETELHQFDEALAAIDRARLVDPLRPRTHYMKGRMLAGIGSFKEAEGLYLRALEIAPDFYPALLRLGEIHWRQGRFAEAVKLGERAAAIEASSPWVAYALADFYLDVGDVEAARAVLADQPEIQWVSVCAFQRETRRLAEIVASNPLAFDSDISLATPENEVIPFAIRDRGLADGHPEKARDALLKRRSLSRSTLPRAETWATTTALAQLQLALGNRKEAEDLARTLVHSDDPHVAYWLAYAKPAAHALLGDKDAAIGALEENVQRPQLARWWYTFERDPALRAALGSDARFRSLAAQVRQHARSQRTLLEQMRARGEAPTRKSAARLNGSC